MRWPCTERKTKDDELTIHSLLWTIWSRSCSPQRISGRIDSEQRLQDNRGRWDPDRFLCGLTVQDNLGIWWSPSGRLIKDFIRDIKTQVFEPLSTSKLPVQVETKFTLEEQDPSLDSQQGQAGSQLLNTAFKLPCAVVTAGHLLHYWWAAWAHYRHRGALALANTVPTHSNSGQALWHCINFYECTVQLIENL